MTLDPKLVEALVKAGSLVFTVLCGTVGAGWTLVRYFDQKEQDRQQRTDIERQRLDQQRADEDGRRSERVASLLSEFNKSTDLEKKTWTLLALSLYPKETGRLLTMSLGQFDDDIAKTVLLALATIGPDVMPELLRLNRIAQVFGLDGADSHTATGDIYQAERLAARTKVAIQNILLLADGGSTELYDLSDVDLSRCTFRGIKLKGANFRKSLLSGAIFKQAHIHNGNFRGAGLENAVFTEAHLQQCDFTGAHGPLQAIRLVLKQSAFDHALFEGSHFEGAYIEASTFLQGSFADAELPGLMAKDCTFDQSDLRHVNATKSRWTATTFLHANLAAANFSHADISGCTFETCKLMGIVGHTVVAHKAQFTNCNFGGSKWASADFTDAQFDACHFGGADFTSCKLDGATFINCIVDTGKFDVDIAAMNRPDRHQPDPHP